MKGIILAGGSGTRLYPLTLVSSKQLLPVYDKPLIYYPLTTLISAGIKDILVISTPQDTPRIESLLGDGRNYGVKLQYLAQPAPEGIAQAFILGESFIGDDEVALILGDNLFYGGGLRSQLKEAAKEAREGKATFFAYFVKDPERFGTIAIDEQGQLSGIREKDPHPSTSYAVTGLYFYPSGVSAKAKGLKKSPRGEYEISDLNNLYIEKKQAVVRVLGRGYTWLDCGTPDSLKEAADFVHSVQSHEGLYIGCPEEAAYREGYIGKDILIERAEALSHCAYGRYLKALTEATYLQEGRIV